MENDKTRPGCHGEKLSWGRVKCIKGFGDGFTRELVDWRKSLERKFVFDPSKGVDLRDLQAVEHRFQLRRNQIETALRAGPQELSMIRMQILQRRVELQAYVSQEAHRLAQARADLTMVSA